MGHQAKGGNARRRRPPVRASLAVIPVGSLQDMALLLAKHNRLMRDYARHYLGVDASEDDVEEVVARTVDDLLALAEFDFPHGLRYVTLALWRECQRQAHRRELRQAPVDRFLGAISGPIARVVDRLGPRSRETILRIAQGETAEEIARSENTTADVGRIRLFRARQRARKLLSESGQSLPGLLLFVPHRLRAFAGRMHDAAAEALVSHSLAATILMPLLACSALWSRAPAPAAVASIPVTMEQHSPVSVPRANSTPALSTVARIVAPRTSVTGVPPSASAPVAITLGGAAAETPEDVTITAAATPADGRPVVLAVGRGKTCNCPVLMQSLDGGATWKATDGPPAGANQLVVPPTYPRDPRIFAGVDRFATGSPYAAAAFGQPFQPLTALPPGQLAVSAHFDDGDARLFSAATTAVWSVRLDAASPAVPHDEVDYAAAAATQQTAAALATPPLSPQGPAVLVWAPVAAVVLSSPSSPSVASTVLRCPVTSACVPVGTLPVLPWRLEARGPGQLLAYFYTAAYASNDDGNSFGPLTLPKDAVSVGSIALAGASPSPWTSFGRADGSDDVARLLGLDPV